MEPVALSSPADEAIREGRLISNTFLLKELVGRGAFGEVWAADNVLSGEKVALKFTTDAAAIRTLRNEVDQIRSLQSAQAGLDGVVGFHTAHLEHSPPFVVMDYAPLGDMSRWIEERQGEPPSAILALDLLEPALHALAELHASNHVHRDIKPTNFLLFDDGFRLTDFSLGAVLHAQDAGVSFVRSIQATAALPAEEAPKVVAGTLGYLAPEVLRGEVAADDIEAWKRADIYSLGVTMVQLLTADLHRPAGAIRLRDPIDVRISLLLERCVDTNPKKRPKLTEDFIFKIISQASLPPKNRADLKSLIMLEAGEVQSSSNQLHNGQDLGDFSFLANIENADNNQDLTANGAAEWGAILILIFLFLLALTWPLWWVLS